jgi:hypothetical protein
MTKHVTILVVAILLTCAASPSDAGPGQGKVFGGSVAISTPVPMLQDSPDARPPSQPLIYAAMGPGQGRVFGKVA